MLVSLTAPAVTQAQTGGLLAKVRERGMIVCGVNPQIPGFGFLDTADNTFKGFDPDFAASWLRQFLVTPPRSNSAPSLRRLIASRRWPLVTSMF